MRIGNARPVAVSALFLVGSGAIAFIDSGHSYPEFITQAREGDGVLVERLGSLLPNYRLEARVTSPREVDAVPAPFTVLAENFPEIERDAVLRIGYVPRDGAGMPDTQGMGLMVRFRAADVTALDPVTVATPDGAVRLAGTRAVGAGDVCMGAFNAPFSCRDWATEGLQALIDHALTVRCMLSPQSPEVVGEEEGARTGLCAASIGGDWVDLSEWTIRFGMNLAEPDGLLIHAQGDAASERRGLWAASWRPEGAPLINLLVPSHSFTDEIDR